MEKPSWRIRRRIIVGTLLYCGAMVFYLAVWGESTSLAEAIATGLILLAGSVIGSYVFGAVWDDRNVMKAQKSEHAPPADFPPGGAS